MTRVSKEKRVEFTIKAGSPEKLKNGWVVVGAFAGGDLTVAARALDNASDGAIAAVLAQGDLDEKAGSTLMLHAVRGVAAPRVLLVSLGKADALRGDYLQALREFDRSIDTFARFRVSDYLANSLREKAAVQLILARPGEADATIRRAVGLLPKLEDSGLATEVLLTQAGIQIARGQLREAHAALAEARTRGAVDADPAVLELRLRWLSAGGEVGQARLLAEHHLPGSGGGKSSSDGVLLAAVQAALRGHDIPLAKAWRRAVATPGAQGEGPSAVSVALAGGLIDRASGAPTAALAQADRAAQLAGPRASPDSEIQTGVLRTMALLATHQYGPASAIMGELEKYAESDYRVAWVMPRLYQALGDKQAAAAAQGRAEGLSGERDVALEPLL